MATIKVNFSSAKLCLKGSSRRGNDNDVVWHSALWEGTEWQYKPREYFVDEDSLIIYEPISNMMHVMFGDRPCSTFRNPFNFSRIGRIDEIVKNGYYRIDNIYSYEDKKDKKDKTHLVSECCQGKKMPWNSHSTKMYHTKNHLNNTISNGWLTWSYLEKYLCYSTYKETTTKGKTIVECSDDRAMNYPKFVSLLTECFGKTIFNEGKPMYSLTEVLGEIGKKGGENQKRVSDFISKNSLTPLLSYVINYSKGTGTINESRGNRAELMVNHYVQKKITLNGSFIFEVTDEEYEMLKRGPRFATYLDGGVASIEFLGNMDYNEYELVEEKNYTKISD